MEVGITIDLEQTVNDALINEHLEHNDKVILIESLIENIEADALDEILPRMDESDLEDLITKIDFSESQRLALILALVGELTDIVSIARVYKEVLTVYTENDDGNGPLKGVI